MVVQPCRIARCATGSFRSIQSFFFFDSFSLSFSHAHAHTGISGARNTLPPLIREFETSILLLGPRRYCRIAAILPIHSSHYSPTRVGIGKDEPIHPFSLPRCGLSEIFVLWGWSNETRFWKFFFRDSSFLYYNVL